MTPTSVTVSSDLDLRELIQDCYNVGATALYLQIGRSPFYRLYGKLLCQDHYPIVTPDRYSQYVQALLMPDLLREYQSQQKLDAQITVPGFCQGRINCGPTTQGVQSLSLSSLSGVMNPSSARNRSKAALAEASETCCSRMM